VRTLTFGKYNNLPHRNHATKSRAPAGFCDSNSDKWHRRSTTPEP
jgi:hypothetical protein